MNAAEKPEFVIERVKLDELQTAANDLLRGLNREVFNNQIDILKLPQAVGMVENFGKGVAASETARADRAEADYKKVAKYAHELEEDAKSDEAEIQCKDAALRSICAALAPLSESAK